MEKKFEYHLGSNSIQVWLTTTNEKIVITLAYLLQGSKVLDQYRTEKGELFESEYVCYTWINLKVKLESVNLTIFRCLEISICYAHQLKILSIMREKR